MNNCPTCYRHTIASCTKIIRIANGLPPIATFTITFTDKFGSVFVTSGNSNSFGMLQINTENLPPYLLNPHAGDVTVQFYSSCGPATPYILPKTIHLHFVACG